MKISLLLTIVGVSYTNNAVYAASSSSDTPKFLRGIAVEGNNACDCITTNDCPSGQYCDVTAGDDGICNIKQNGSIYGKCTNDDNRNPQCYNLGQTCDRDSDCHMGGFNPCTTCGQTHGTQYYHRCYTPDNINTPRPTRRPTPNPTEPGMCGISCYHDSDCKSQYAGTYNPCMVCSRNHGAAVGTRYMCIEPPETPSPTPMDDDDDWDRTNSQPCNYKDTHKGGTGCRVPGQICVKTGDLPCETDSVNNGCCVPVDDWLSEMNELMDQSSV